jgi:hypothetical protein
MSDLFGPIISTRTLSERMASTVEEWIEEYLRETELQHAVTDELPVFASYNVRPANERWVEEQLPALIFVIPGTDGAPTRDGEGNYTAAYRVGVAIYCLGPDKDLTDRNSKLYAAAVRAILLHQSGLGGLADGMYWMGENFDVGPTKQGRTIGAAVLDYLVYVPGMVNKLTGPNVPSDLGHVGSDWPEVETADIEVEKKEEA